MALIVCGDCDCHFESTARACPHCGATRRSSPSRAVALGLVVGAGLLGGCGTSQPLYGSVVTDVNTDDTAAEVPTGDTAATSTDR